MTSQHSSGDTALEAIAHNAVMLASLLEVVNLDVAAPAFAQAGSLDPPLRDKRLIAIVRQLRDLARAPSHSSATKRLFVRALDGAEQVIRNANPDAPRRHRLSRRRALPFVTRHFGAPHAPDELAPDDALLNALLATLRTKRAEIEHNWQTYQQSPAGTAPEARGSETPTLFTASAAAAPLATPTAEAVPVPVTIKRARKV